MASSGEEKEDGQDDAVGSDSEVVLDLCGRRLKRLEKAPANQAYATALVLDNNQLQNLANLDSYGELERLSIANNQVVRMYWFARMYSLRVLNLPNNNIVQVEGLRELIHLVHLNLAGNKIKTIEGLSYNKTLEHLNLSGNTISHINDLSMLKNLKECFLHRNRISTLYRCNKYLPPGLIILTLSDNALVDLNELCNLSHLNNLQQVTILNNPCLDPLQPTDEAGQPYGPLLAFDYRPYVINWCLNLKVLDGYKVTPKESLKAEWLYSQGKGRGFQVGEHVPLVQYLSGVCLAGGGWGGADLPDDDDKLAKILQLAKQHQHDLRHSVNGQDTPSESTNSRNSRSHQDSPATIRRHVARSTSAVRRNTAPSRAAPQVRDHRRTHSHSSSQRNHPHSYHVELSNTLYGGDLRTPDTPSLMTQSMDPAILSQLASGGPYSAPQGTGDPMSRSLGAEQLSRSLRGDAGGIDSAADQDMMSQSMGEEELRCLSEAIDFERSEREARESGPHGREMGPHGRDIDPRSRESGPHYDPRRDPGPLAHGPNGTPKYDPMTQSQGPEQLRQSLKSDPMTRSLDFPHYATPQQLTNGDAEMWGERVGSHAHMNAHTELNAHIRPTTLFGDDLTVEDIGEQEISGSTKFVPAPESMMSPEYQHTPQTHHNNAPHGPARPHSTSSRPPAPSGHSQRPPSASRPTPSAPQAIPRQQANLRSSSASRSRPTPMKSPAPSNSEISRASPSRSQTRASVPGGPQTLPRPKPSPRPAPRYARSVSVEPAARRQTPSKKKSASSPHQGYSSADSDNTDSEMSASKLQTIKSIAAERKVERRGRDPNTVPYDPEKYKPKPMPTKDGLRRWSNSSSGSSAPDVSKTQAAITLQRHWRGYHTRHHNPNAAKIRDDIRHSRAEQHIRHLSDKLRSTEEALERERKLRHMQLEAIRTLWREIQKLQASKREGGSVNTPSTPMTPLTPLTPLESGGAAVAKVAGSAAGGSAAGGGGRKYSEESVKELTEFCAALQSQVGQLQDSLSMVTQVMNAFCNLPGSQSLLTMSQSSGSGHERSPGGVAESPPSQGVNVPLSESVTSLTHSIRALTTSIVKSPGSQKKAEGGGPEGNGSGGDRAPQAQLGPEQDSPESEGSDGTPVACIKNAGPQDLSHPGHLAQDPDLNSTTQDISTLSVDSTEGADTTGDTTADTTADTGKDDLSESSQSSLSGSLSEGRVDRGGAVGPLRPSSLPVPRPHTPRS